MLAGISGPVEKQSKMLKDLVKRIAAVALLPLLFLACTVRTSDFSEYDTDPTAKAYGNVLEITLPHSRMCSECWSKPYYVIKGDSIYLTVRLIYAHELPYIVHKKLPKPANSYKLYWIGTGAQLKEIPILPNPPASNAKKN